MIKCRLEPRSGIYSILIGLAFLLLLNSIWVTDASVYCALVVDSYSSIASPPIILQNGTTGTSTIYTNNTSAKVSVQAPTTWLNGWDKRVRITIDRNDIDTDLPSFPILVYLSNSSSGRNNDDVSFIFDELQNDTNRKKIVVTKSDGLTQCYIEIEKWDSASEQAWLWVKVPNISNTTDTELYLYYDKDHADNVAYVGDPNSTPAENVWDSNFKLASHMKDDPDISHIRDSTSNNNDGTKEAANNPIQTDGKIGRAQNFTSDYINCGTNNTLNIRYTLTIEAWINPDSLSAVHQNSIVDRGSSYWFLVMTDETLAFLRFKGDFNTFKTIETIPTGTWTHVTATYNNSASDEAKLYINGQLSREGSLDGPIDSSASSVLIGDRGPNLHHFDGIIDEVQISNTVRSAAWIKASYESGRDDLLDFGLEENRLSGWNKRIKITIDNNDVDSALSSFPVLVYLSNSSGRNNNDVSFVFDELQSDNNRKKIAVTTNDGTTECYVEIERWDSANEQAWLWVNVPSISNTTDTDLYLYYDKDHADNNNYVGDIGSNPAENVWDNNFVLVWHMSEEGEVIDSTQNSNNGTVTGLTSVVGKIGHAKNSSGGSNGIVSTNNLTLGTGKFTVEGWFNPNVYTTEWIGLFGPKDPTEDYNEIMWPYQGKWGYYDRSVIVTSNQPIMAGQWDYYTAVREGIGSSQLENYINGLYDNAGTSTLDFTAQPVWLGKSSTYPWNGISDELRISNISRSATWIKASYESGRDDLINFESQNYDYVLIVNNTVTDSWQIRLKQYSDSNINRLQNCTIYFHNSSDGTSRQIYIQNGAYINQTGPWYDLGESETIYIAMTVEASSPETSSVYAYLEILSQGTTTYAQYIIEFSIG